MTSKNDVLTSILTFFCQMFCRGATIPTSRLGPVLLFYRPPQHGRSPAGPWSAVRCGARQHSYQFLVPGRVERRGRQVYSRVSLYLSKVILPHRSGRIPETAALYYTSATYRRGEFTPRESEVKTKQTTVVNGLPGPWLI
jgi:hypothetical protein